MEPYEESEELDVDLVDIDPPYEGHVHQTADEKQDDMMDGVDTDA